MLSRGQARLSHPLWVGVALLLGAGCQHQQLVNPVDSQIPRELSKVTLPSYVIEPPDILLIDVIRTVPLPPYRIEPFDLLEIQVSGLPEEAPPIAGLATVQADGTLDLGREYGTVRVVDMTIPEAQDFIEKFLMQKKIKAPKVNMFLRQSRALQLVRGEHLVRPDGIISLGLYGSVYVTGMTVPEAKAAIEEHLSRFIFKPEISVDILAYNSKVFYVITDGGGFGQQVTRLPITGNETVLDAISKVAGLPYQASKHRIWVARPAPAHDCGDGKDQILPVEWNRIVECGQTATNYQILPGDRIYVSADALITLDNWLSKITAPMERVFGVTLLGDAVVRQLGGKNNGNGTGTGTGF
jgi:polysaccharide export outer membrane protein